MRIIKVASTDLFTGTLSRPLQIIKVSLANDGPGMLRDLNAKVTVSVQGPGVSTPVPASASRLVHGEERTVEVGVEVSAPVSPRGSRPVTAIARTPAGQTEVPGQITVAEAGWTMWMVSHFHYDPVWWNTQAQFTQTWPLMPGEGGVMPEVRTVFELVRLHLEAARSDPDYKFVLAELDYLKPYFDAHPQDRADLLDFIRTGRIEIVGGSYNEPNTNLTCAESTIRNAVYGLEYQRGVLGAAPSTAWMLDAFGFDPAYPGLMAAAGLPESSWARGPFHQWGPSRTDGGNRQMQFPSEFEWLSPDGTGLLTSYMPNHYSAGWITQHAADLEAAERDAYSQFRQLAPVAATRNVLLPVGGDHVVPSRWATQIHRDWNARYVWPRFVTAVPSEFFAAVRSDAQASGAWFMPQTRDMNPVYPGKDVTYIDTKQAQRDAEIALLDGERLATLAWLAGARYPTASLDKAWRLLVFGAHHDAITGTEGDQVYLDLLAGWREAFERGDSARRQAASYLASLADTAAVLRTAIAHDHAAAPSARPVGKAIPTVPLRLEDHSPAAVSASTRVLERAGGGQAGSDPAPDEDIDAGPASGTDGRASAIVVFNTLAWPRSGLATIALSYAAGAAATVGMLDDSGADVAFLAEGVARHPDGSLASVTLTFRARAVPALGYRTYLAVAGAAGADLAAHGWQRAEGVMIDNEAFRVEADPNRGGVLRSIVDRRSGTELLAGPGNEFVLQDEYPSHPRWGEGPWLLCLTGTERGSANMAATVRAERCPIGARLVTELAIDDLRVTAETLTWTGEERVDFRTHVDGSIGQDRLLRTRFRTDVPGGLPIYQSALAVVGRTPGRADVDVAKHTYTLDHPAHEWFGVGSVARIALIGEAGERRLQAMGVAEVVAPAGSATDRFAPRDSLAGYGSREAVRDLVIALARQGVTATCSVPEGPRYGSIDLDSNLPDVRIALGGPEENAFTAQVLALAGPVATEELEQQLAAYGTARIWIAACRRRSDLFGAAPELRGLADLPVLIVAGQDLGAAIAAFVEDLEDAQVEVRCRKEAWGEEPGLARHSIALLNRGLPGSLVTPDGDACIALMRACSGWPAGVWIDGEKRLVPDGSSFAWQHWSHTFEYAFAADAGDWRAAGYPVAGQEYSHRLIACQTAPAAGPWPAAMSLASVTPAGVDLMALKPAGNPLAPRGQPDPRDGVTARLRDLTGRPGPGSATVRLFTAITAAHTTGLCEESGGTAASCEDGAVLVDVPARGTVTLRMRPGGVNGSAGAGLDGLAAGHVDLPELPEPTQPVFTRYWLHGKGPAPAGNLPVAVHLSPAEVALAAGGSGTVSLTVACGPAPAAGSVTVVVPPGLSVSGAASSGVGPGSGDSLTLGYDLAANGFAAWDLVAQAGPDCAAGRRFLTASIADGAGQICQDAVVVAVGELPPPPEDAPLEEVLPWLEAAGQAEAGEAQLTCLTGHLALPPGARGQIAVRLANATHAELHGEAQLISPHGSWAAVTPWSTGFSAGPGGSATLAFDVAVPADARPGQRWWALVKVMFFGRLRYSAPVWLEVVR
jgi:alpha-mannosidase